MTTLTLTGFVGVPVVDAAGVRVRRLSDLLPLLYGISRDADLMGEHATGRREAFVTLAAIGVVALAVGTLAVVSLLG